MPIQVSLAADQFFQSVLLYNARVQKSLFQAKVPYREDSIKGTLCGIPVVMIKMFGDKNPLFARTSYLLFLSRILSTQT